MHKVQKVILQRSVVQKPQMRSWFMPSLYKITDIIYILGAQRLRKGKVVCDVPAVVPEKEGRDEGDIMWNFFVNQCCTNTGMQKAATECDEKADKGKKPQAGLVKPFPDSIRKYPQPLIQMN